MVRTSIRALAFAFLGLAFLVQGDGFWPSPAESARQGSAPVYIVLWFDTEDYILPQSDDAALRIATLLERQGVRATFKVVGEKGRTLERRGRRDVIRALARHEIGYHSNTHSQHPTVAEYEEAQDWEGGAAEFTRRERPGYDDVRRIFGKAPTCYGQPGSSWAPQSYPALKSWGVNVYLDEGEQVGLEGKPFWYGGLLNIFNTPDGRKLMHNDDWSNLAEAKANFQEIYGRMSVAPEGGLVSLYFHPAEFIHQQFWDAVNFVHGANPPREEWKLPPMMPPEQRERAFKYLDDLVAYMRSFPRVRFITASEAKEIFEDGAQKHAFQPDELADIARRVGPDVTFQTRDEYSLSASEVLALLNQFVVARIQNQSPAPIRLKGTPYGPSIPLAGDERPIEVPWKQFSRTVLDVESYLEKNNQVPDAVWFGSSPVTSERYLVALAKVAIDMKDKGQHADSIEVGPARLAAARFVADDSPRLWDWIIFPPGFRAPHLMALAKLQAWTLKPAMSHHAD